MLTKLETKYSQQSYLECLYKSLFSTMYYALMRVGEVAESPHAVRVTKVHQSTNKRKFLLILDSSKTHGRTDRPQELTLDIHDKVKNSLYCPVQLAKNYSILRPKYNSPTEQFYIFQDYSPVRPENVRKIMRELIDSIGLDSNLYDTHSFRIGRATDMLKAGFTVEQIKRKGRWRSNAVFKYLRE